MHIRSILFAVATLSAACSSATPSAQSPTSATEAAATEPNGAKLAAHLEQHVQYPATRSDVLAACAHTPEFTQGEKQWTAEHLPEGSYDNADEVARALGI